MHPSGTVTLGCATCHGGDPKVAVAAGLAMDSAEYKAAKNKAHPQPRVSDLWKSAANPERAYTQWLKESQEYIQFVNPGDLRVVDKTCGSCHAAEVRNVRTSMMTTGAMLWEAALYNNGGAPYKNARYGESYAPDGTPQRLQAFPAPTAEETKRKGWLPFLEPLPRWEVTQPGNVLRAFERGGGKKAEIGNPTKNEEPGRPDIKLSDRGFGTELRTDPVFLGCRRRACSIPCCRSPARTISRATTATAAARAATSSTRTTARRITRRSTPRSATTAARRRSTRRSIRSGRAGPPDQAHLHAVDSVQPVHDLPHAPRHEHGHDLLRLHVVGERDRRRADVSGHAEAAAGRRTVRDPQPQPRAVGAEGQLGGPEVPRPGRHGRSSTRSSSTRSSPTSTATAGSIARSTSATAAATCWTPTTRSCRTTIRSGSARPST